MLNGRQILKFEVESCSFTNKINHRLITIGRKGISVLKNALHNVSLGKVTYVGSKGACANGHTFSKREMTCKVQTAKSLN